MACGKRDAARHDAAGVAPSPSVAVTVPTVDWADAKGPAGPLSFSRKLRTPGRWLFAGTMEANLDDIGAKLTIELSTTGDGTARMMSTVTPDGGDREQRNEITFDEAGRSEQDPTGALVAVLWPIPPRLRVGESAIAPFAFPFNVQGRSKSDWTQTVTFVGYSRVGAITCARFTSTAVMELPDDGAGSFGRAMYGAQFCLDPADGMIVASANEMTSEMSVVGMPASMMHIVNRFARVATP
jgi:hypothetical protein